LPDHFGGVRPKLLAADHLTKGVVSPGVGHARQLSIPNCFSTVIISSVSIRVNPWLHSPHHSAALCRFLFTCVHVPILPLSYGSCHCIIVHHSFTSIARLTD
jgi:hypothetical protein